MLFDCRVYGEVRCDSPELRKHARSAIERSLELFAQHGRVCTDILSSCIHETYLQRASLMRPYAEGELNTDRRHVRRAVLHCPGEPPRYLCPRLRDALHPHQSVGVRWLFGRLCRARVGAGAILGDDPGLGKTLQVIALISALVLFSYMFRPDECSQLF